MNFIAYAIFALAALLLQGCASESGGAGAPAARKIGAILPLKNPAAIDALDGMKLAAEIRNAAIAPELRFEILKADSDTGARGHLKIISDMSARGARVFCAGFDGEILKSHKIMSGMGGAFFNFMMIYPPATLEGKNSTRMFFNSAQECQMLAAKANAVKGGGKVFAVLSEDSPMGKSAGDFMAFSISEADRKVFRDYFSKGEGDFNVFAAQILHHSPRAIFCIGAGGEFAALEAALARAGYGGLLLRNRGFLKSPARGAGIAVAARFESRPKTGAGRAFCENFKKKYGREPSVFAAWGFDGANALMDAFEKTGGDPAKMRAQFTSVKKRGVLGELSFDSSADCTAELELVQ